MYRLPKSYIIFVCCAVLITCLVFRLVTRFPDSADLLSSEKVIENRNVAHKSEDDSADSTDFSSSEKFIENRNVAHKSEDDPAPWVIVFWSNIFGVPQNFHLLWKKGECPVACEVTTDRSRAAEANGFVVHGADGHMTPPHHNASWIMWTQENPWYARVLSDPKVMSRYNLLRSYRLDSDFPNPVYPMPELTAPLPFKEKTGIVMAAFSNCEPVRTEYLKQLMQYVQVDSYGACHKNKDGLIGRYGAANGKTFKDLKVELARKYKFLLVFFNEDCDYFVDDQLTHALNAGSVPVVMGTDKLDEFLPGNLRRAVIKVRDFKSPKILAEYLNYLTRNEAEYNKYLEWKQTGIGDFTGTVIGNYWQSKYDIYCQMCVALSEGRVHKDGLPIDNCQRRKAADWGLEQR